MEWLQENWFWLLVILLFVGMHLGHGGHGGHGGGGGGHGGHGDRDTDDTDKPKGGQHAEH